jgi:hypothetical protein
MCCDKGKKPNATGDKCEEEQCEQGKKKNDKGECELDCGEGKQPNAKGDKCEDCPNNKCELKCAEGRMPDSTGKKCEDCPNKKCPDKNDDEDAKKRRGKCKDGEMLDPMEGEQTVDTPNPKCVPDDYKNCKKGEIPETRNPGDTDPKTEIKCGKLDDKDKKNCDSKRYYIKTWIDMISGKVSQECKLHNKYKEKRRKEADKQKPDRKKKWRDEEPKRQEAERKRKEKEEEARKKMEEWKKKDEEMRKQQMEEKEKKKSRMGKCLPLVALFIGMYQDLKKRDGEEHPYDWTTEYFTEDWIEKTDDVLEYWPGDVNVNEISPDESIDNDEWMKKWNAIIEAEYLRRINPSRTMQWKRCDSVNGTCDEDAELVEVVDEEPVEVREVEDVETHISQALALREAGTVSHHYEKRFFQIFFAIAAFCARLAINIAQGVAKAVTKVSDRIAKIVGKDVIDTKKLFQLAKGGTNNGKNAGNMKNAADKIRQSEKWKQCIKGGKP